jgi:hypothetical protein
MTRGSGLITVYFDTSFFVDLLRASLIDARTVVSGLNDMGVRYVQAPGVYDELARGRGDGDSVLLERLTWFDREPLHLSSMLTSPGEEDDWNIDWSSLAMADGREELAQTHLQLGRSESYLSAIVSAANVDQRSEQLTTALFGDYPDLIESIRAEDPDAIPATVNNLLHRKAPWQSDVPYRGDAFLNLEAVHQIGSDAFQSAGLGPAPSFELALRDPQAYRSLLADLIGPRMFRLIEAKRDLGAFQASIDDRAIRAISENMPRRAQFESTQRDFEHMAYFVAFADEIDFLQIDGPRSREIEAYAAHPMRLWGFHDRYFHSAFTDTVTILRGRCF